MSTPLPGGQLPGGQPTIPREQQLKNQLDGLSTSIRDANARIAAIQNRLDHMGEGVAYRPVLEVQLAQAKTTLGDLNTKKGLVQNQYYEATGEYEKLLTGGQRDAYMAVNALFKNYGLESLAPKIFDYVKNGYSADTISVLLSDTSEYKQRFLGNEARKKAGLPVLSPAEYLATENAYRQIMDSAGLPKGFYDKPSDFAGFIGKDVSPTEIKGRVDLAVQATTLADDNVKTALKQMGIAEGDMVAYWLDKDKALPVLTRAAATAQIGAQALSQGLGFDVGYSQTLAQRGITAEQASQGYSSIAAELENLSTLGSIYGQRWNQRMSEAATFEGEAGAINARRRLASQERGQFGGAAGAARGGLAQRGGQR